MSKSAHHKEKAYYNFLPLRFLYIAIFALVGVYWSQFKSLSPHLFSHAAVLWILNLYRGLNKDKTSIENQFFISFWVRMGWATCNTYFYTGQLFTDKDAFALTLVQCFLVTSIYTAIPLHYVQVFWSHRVCRWIVFIIDQPFANGFTFSALVKKEFFTNSFSTIWQPVLVMTSKAVARPTMQILTGLFNGNLFWNNLRKWSTICYLNTCRILLLTGINCYIMNNWLGNTNEQQLLQYFNVCYYGLVGYLMYLQTYTL